MNSEWGQPPEDGNKTGQGAPGAQLKAQREALGLSVEQIADQLKLAPRQVVALEAGDYDALPNMAVTRGFVRAYAKVVRLDATPLVAMIAVQAPTQAEVLHPRKDLSASFSESRLPLMTSNSSGKGLWLVGALVVVALGGAATYAYQAGLTPASLFAHPAEETAAGTTSAGTSAATVAPLETTLVKPGQETTTLQSPNVPLVSVPPADGVSATPGPGAAATAPAGAAPAAGGVVGVAGVAGAGAAGAPATAATTPVAPPAAAPAAPAAPAPAGTVAGNPAGVAAPAAPAAITGTALVLKVNEDSWVEIRRPGAPALVSRVVKAGSVETFDIKGPSLLVVGKPAGVQATLGGAPLALPVIAGGTISRVNIK